jgi:hypothetical protein
MARARLELASAKINSARAICCVAKSSNLAYNNLPEHIEGVMSKQLAVSAAFSIFMMATYVLFGGQVMREPRGREASEAGESRVEVTAPALPSAKALLPSLR